MASTSVQLTLHWLDRSRAQRIIWLLEELNLQYRLVTYKRLSDNQAPASLKTVHPLGKSPVLEINQPRWTKPLVLAESANIVEYIVEHFGPNLIPEKWRANAKIAEPGSGLREETEEWTRYRFYMHYSEGSLTALVGTGALKNAIKAAPVPFFIKLITGRIARQIESDYLNHNFESHLSFLESELSSYKPTPSSSEPGSSFICGPKLTAADFMIVFPLEGAQQIADFTDAKYPLLTRYVRMLQGRESYKRAIKRIVKETGSYTPGI